MKRIFPALLLCCSLNAAAEDYIFDFHQPETLVPAVAEPQQKGFVELDGRTFTSGPVELSFTNSGYGNTHVRIYHSYDAGIDLRLYDGDAMQVSVPENLAVKAIQFTMSLSGASSGSNDINFIPDTGEFIWEDEKWIPSDGDSDVSSVELVSALQSRIYTVTVSVEPNAGIDELVAVRPDARYFNLLGRPVAKPVVAGIYLEVCGGATRKVVVK
ncbi:MAG: hypothetical protein HDR45_04810 [Bacteroides sp.]|nr:hypothetical protein [Bacteroides sp.]